MSSLAEILDGGMGFLMAIPNTLYFHDYDFILRRKL